MTNCPQCLQPSCNPRVYGDCVFYTGPNIPSSGIVSGDALNTVVLKLSTSGGGVGTANNGLSVNGSNIVLGQDTGQLGNPAALLSNREIPTGSFSISLKDTSSTNVLRSDNIVLSNSTTQHNILISPSLSNNVISLITSNSAVDSRIVLGTSFNIWGVVGSSTDISLVWNDGMGGAPGLKMFPSTDLQFTNYPDTRDDGPTSIAFYPDTDGNLKVGPVNLARIVSPEISSIVTVSDTDINKMFSNEGATGTVNFMLPPAQVGLSYAFVSQNSNALNITASSGDTIRIGGNVTGTGGTVQSVDTGSVITIIAINGTEWVAVSFSGTWTI